MTEEQTNALRSGNLINDLPSLEEEAVAPDPAQAVADAIQKERTSRLDARDKKLHAEHAKTAAAEVEPEDVEDDGPPKGRYWKLLDSVERDGLMDSLYAIPIMGGVIVRSVLAGETSISQSMVFMPGYEVTPDNVIRQA